MTKFASTEERNRLIKKFLIGGAGLGVGVGSAVSLANLLKSIQRDKEDRTKTDDDTLYITLPNNKKSAATIVDGGLALTGAALTAAGSYALVRQLAQRAKRKRLQERLDRAQQVYLDRSLGDEVDVKAGSAEGRGWTGSELGGAAAASIPILALLASGALTYKTLDKYFPKPEPSTNRQRNPKKIVVRYKDQEQQTPEGSEEEELLEKEATYEVTELEEKLADRFLIRFAQAYEDEFSSRHSGELLPVGINKVANAVASGMLSVLEDSTTANPTVGPFTKAAAKSATRVTALQKTAANACIVNSPEVGPAVLSKAAAVALEVAPELMTEVREFVTDPVYQALLTKYAAALEESMTADEMEESGIPVESLDDAGSKEMSAVSEEDILRILMELESLGAGEEQQTPADLQAVTAEEVSES